MNVSKKSTGLLDTPSNANLMSYKTRDHRSKKKGGDAQRHSPLFHAEHDADISYEGVASGLEFLKRVGYCQALLYKAWVEASDEVARKVRNISNDAGNSKELLPLYVNTFEEKFTNLFRSPEFSLNVSKILASLMESIRTNDGNNPAFFLSQLSGIDMSKMNRIHNDGNGKREKLSC
jgi:hypothetical protein